MRDGWTETIVSSLLSRSIGGVWGAEPGVDREDVMVVRSTEFTKSGVLNYTTGVPRSITSGQLASRELSEGDILLEKSGGGPEQPVGRVVYVESDIPPRFVCSNFIQLLTPVRETVLPRFLFLSMWTWHFQNKTLEYQAQTTGIRNLRTPDYLEQLINLPPIAEQKRIVDVVSSVDAYTDALQQQVDAARTARNAVLHELLTAGGEDWTETTLGEVAQWSSGGTPQSGESKYYDGDIPWCVIGDLTEGEVFVTEKQITQDGLQNSSAKIVQPGAVMIAMYGASIGRTGLVAVPMATNQAIACAIPNVELLDNLFLLIYLQTQKTLFVEAGQGAAQPNISQTVLKRWPIPLPSIAEQKRIVEIVSSMDDVVQAAESAVVEAKNLRSGLLSDLLSGEHEIPVSYDELLGAA